ncbi:hypothetical protein IWQ62_002895 [Dispira parvispora]|uniref:GATA-type domain-containing protein n=1 Tax=Dispira parvispora TaxID=1520584 RepID=A0A9W8APG3_9FUNG|nr:hypothetical protein IWQ62_002895 [Dispira parvispora]
MAPLVLKIKGNKLFSQFSEVGSVEELSKTWRIITKVKDSLEDGSRLENLSWRLWHLHSLVLDDCDIQPFRKLSAKTTAQLESNKKSLRTRRARTNNQSTSGGGNIPKPRRKRTKAPASPDVTCPPPQVPNPPPHSLSQPVTPQSTGDEETPNLSPGDPDYFTAPGQSHGAIFVSQNDDESANSFSSTAFHQQQPLMQLEDIINNYGATVFLGNFENPPHIEISLDDLLQMDTSAWSSAPTAGVSTPDATSHGVTTNALMNNAGALSLMPSTGGVSSTGVPTSSHAPTASFSNSLTTPGQATAMQSQSSWVLHNATVNGASLANDAPVSAGQTLALSNSLGMGASSSVNGGGVGSSPLAAGSAQNGTGSAPYSSPETAGLSAHLTTGNNPQGGYPNTAATHPKSTTTMSQTANTISFAPNVSSQSRVSPVQNIVPAPSNVRSSTAGKMATAKRPSPSTTTSAKRTSSTAHQSCGTRPSQNGNGVQVCANCGVTSTPLWRRSDQDKLLCNACGLYYKLHNTNRPKSMRPNSLRKDGRADDQTNLPVCAHCETSITPLWRRDEEGATLCNACGLYYKLHQSKRPLSLKSDVIRKRQRFDPPTRNARSKKSGDKGGISTSSRKTTGGGTRTNAHITMSAPTPPPPASNALHQTVAPKPLTLNSLSTGGKGTVFNLPGAPIVATTNYPTLTSPLGSSFTVHSPTGGSSPLARTPTGPLMLQSANTGGLVSGNGGGSSAGQTHRLASSSTLGTANDSTSGLHSPGFSVAPTGNRSTAPDPTARQQYPGANGNEFPSLPTHSLINFTSFHGTSGYY